MCDICKEICEDIKETFGHKVDPKKLCELIESSPVSKVNNKEEK